MASGEDTEPALPRPHGGFPVTNWSRYEFIQQIGSGGMGVVYKARDRSLNRIVALKFIRGDDAHLSERFMQEAKAQARIAHENVCKVYEVGEIEGMPYIAMQFIEGKPVHKVMAQLSLEARVQVVCDIAEALHAAHRLGIIHRDIKPANVMLQPKDDGGWRPVLMDFGLARETGNSNGLTQSGAVMGTPAYMSPEQARGDRHELDRRADIYSLGAMLYELLVGKPPFEGLTTINTLLQVLHDEPVSLRRVDATVPIDLETITMKCLEKEPARRYESALALAHDLQAYQEGEPITARQPTWSYRLSKRVRKHRRLATLSGITFALMATSIGMTVHAEVRAKRQVQLAQQFGEEAREIETWMRYAHMSPLHDIRIDEEMAKRRMEHIYAEMASAGPDATGPGLYALGRSYLAFGEYGKAYEHLDKARKSGFRFAGLVFAMGQAMEAIYRRERESAPAPLPVPVQQARLTEIESYLRAASASDSAEKEYERAYVDGLIAYDRGDYGQALKWARAASGRVPWLYEAKLLEGDVYRVWAGQKLVRGDLEMAKGDLLQAELAYQAAADLGRSDPAAHLQLARLWQLRTEVNSAGRAAAAAPSLARWLAACESAQKAYSMHNEALRCRAEANRWVAMHGASVDYPNEENK